MKDEHLADAPGPRADSFILGGLIALCTLALVVLAANDLATIVRVRQAGDPAVRHAQGIVDHYRIDHGRAPVFRLSRVDAPPVLLTCANRALADHPPCPPESADWNARAVSVDWIDLTTGLLGRVVHRATQVSARDRQIFAAAVADVLAAEVAASVVSIRRECAAFGPMLLFFWTIALLARRQRHAVAARVEAARRRSEARTTAPGDED